MASGLYWYPALGWGTFWIGLIIAIILFSTKKKFYPVLYLASISLYVFTIGFMVDVFDFTKNWVLLTLAISSILMMLAGVHISKRSGHHDAGDSLEKSLGKNIASKRVKNSSSK